MRKSLPCHCIPSPQHLVSPLLFRFLKSLHHFPFFKLELLAEVMIDLLIVKSNIFLCDSLSNYISPLYLICWLCPLSCNSLLCNFCESLLSWFSFSLDDHYFCLSPSQPLFTFWMMVSSSNLSLFHLSSLWVLLLVVMVVVGYTCLK